MKKILVPTDFSATAEKALNYAIQLAKRTNAQIVVLHVAELLDPDYDTEPEAILNYNDKEISHLNYLLIKAQAHIELDEKLHSVALLYNGKVVDSIKTVAEKYNIDMIVMGTQGKHNLRTNIFGTRTAEVIAATTVPVIAVPESYEWTEPKNILLAMNEQNDSENVLAPVFSIANAFAASVSTVIFSDEDANPVELLEDEYVMQEVKYRINRSFGRNVEALHIEGTDFSKTMQEFITEQDVDMLVMITHKRSFLETLFASSMTKKMAYHTKVPLLSLHAE
jgi:nucleotide-binding universal stress UspA family protein